MSDLLIYFLKSSGLLFLFLGCYYFFLRKETMFRENRYFLLIGMLISLLLPFAVITKYIEIPAVSNATERMFVLNETSAFQPATVSWATVLGYVYMSGVLIFFIKFIIELGSLFKLLWSSKIIKRDERFLYFETTASISPFSFFNCIVYNPSSYSSEELEAILQHEQAHSSQLHSLDLFISKLFCIFMWFNPFVWIYKKFILQNLEFMADQTAVAQTSSKKTYQLTLLKVSGNTFSSALTNNFYNSLIKKRIVMLQKTPSAKLNRWKQLLIVPMLVAFVFLFNTEVVAKEIPVTISETEITSSIDIAENVGDLVVVITKKTTVEELKAFKKLFSSQKIKFSYSNINFNNQKEISSISITLSSKNMQTANAEFKSSGNKAIAEIQLGKRNDELFISSNAFTVANENSYTYTITSDDKNNKSVDKKIIVRKVGKGETKVESWIQKDDIKTIDIRKEGEKEIVIVNGKQVKPGTIIEEEIEIKKENGDGKNYIFINSSDNNDDEEVEIEVIEEKESNIVFRNSKNTEPLIIIDGKIADSTKMNELNSNSIESVSVLKGESATKKYGKKAKDGAIEITTKQKK